ncbi:MAG TPA: general secretion pathway protein GspE [Planctomycetes bacterium]|nr:general secretion pathway protein GspE [Planctomycetota bacterium]
MSRLGEILVERGAVTLEEVARARDEQQAGERLGDALVRLSIASPFDVAGALAELSGVALCDLREEEPTKEALDAVPTRFVFRSNLLPLARDNGTLVVGTSDPFAVEALDELRLLTGFQIQPRLIATDQLADAIAQHYGVGADALDQAAAEGLRADLVVDEEGDLEADDDAALIQFVNRLLLDAVHARASDIHVEPLERDLLVRYRIDGVLQPAKLPRELKRFQQAIVSRVKIMAQLDIAEKRLPQDGRIRLKVQGHELDVRVSVIPTLYGEGLALRILDAGGDKKAGVKGLTEIGFSEAQSRTFIKFLSAPHGIVLVTGPTGSGKSTTLYTGLQQIDRDTRKVITIEDPVEYRLDRISQIQVRDKIGLTFARGLRHILRHDPDVVMVGEIRDQETAEIAVQAALTGHLVLSTLHTNDAAGAVARLVDMGVEPYLVAATIEGLCAQRLLRRICPHCAITRAPLPEEREPLEELGLSELTELRVGQGCEACNESGYFGRTPVFELLPVDDGVRELATQSASAVQMRNYVREKNVPGLRDDGLRLVRSGVTTWEEVVRVTRAS